MSGVGTWFGSTWSTVGFVVAGTAAIYLSAIVVVRLAGRRTVAQMSAFDAIVTVALGSLLATTAVSSEVSYAEGMTALTTLLVLQVVVAALRQRFPSSRRYLEFAPEIVVDEGGCHLPNGPMTSQLTLDELRSQLRKQGVVDPADAALVVLEPDGKVSVLTDPDKARVARRAVEEDPHRGPTP